MTKNIVSIILNVLVYTYYKAPNYTTVPIRFYWKVGIKFQKCIYICISLNCRKL